MENLFVFTTSKLKKDFTVLKDKELIITNNLFLFKNLTENDIFVSYEHQTPLQFRLEFYNIPSDSKVITTKNENLKEVIESKYLEDYAIFSGSEINVLEELTKKVILENLKTISNVMLQMLEAGYLEEKNYKKIDDWIVSFEEPILKLFKNYHIIETSNPSVGFEEEFLINPQFRKMILIMMLKIISNFIINNKMITLKKVAEIGDWKSLELWKKLKNDLKIL